MAPPPTLARSPPSQVPPCSKRGPPAGAAGGPRAPGRPHSPSLRRDVVWRFLVGTRVFPCLPRPGRVACPLHAPTPQVRQVHVRERPADGHRGTHHRRHPHKYGKCLAVSAGGLCGDQRLPSGVRGTAVFPGMAINVLALFPPLPHKQSWTIAHLEPCVGHTKRAHRVQSQGGFQISEHLEENLSEVWCQCPELGNVCRLWVGDLVTRVCPKPTQPPQLLEASAEFQHQFTYCHQHARVTG